MGLLSDNESWTLFQKHASIDDDFSPSHCMMCHGSLRHSETIDDHMEEGMRVPINCLTLSYAYLKNKEAELLFLMCSMFPEDYEISIEDLIRYALDWGLGGGLSLDISRQDMENQISLQLDAPNLEVLLLEIYSGDSLDLSHSTFEENKGLRFDELPIEIGNLKRLKLLDLSGCDILRENYNGAIGKCSQLERGLLGGCKNIIPDMVGVVGGMNVVDMKSLKELCRGPPLQVLRFFEKLQILHIYGCPQLHSIFPWQCNLRNLKILRIQIEIEGNCTAGEVLFSMSVAQSLQQLEELHIKSCGELKHIIASGREHDSNTNEEIAPALKNSHLCDAQLEEANASKLKYVFGECDCKDHSSHHFENQIMLPCLEEISVHDMENLVGICPENYLAKWPSQRTLSVSHCPQLTRWIPVMAGSKKVVQQKHMPSKLQQLFLRDLPELTLISRVGPAPGQILSLQCLQHLHVSACQNLKSLFSIELPNVEVYFPKLTDISITKCNKLKSLFSIAMVRMLPQLTTVDISEAPQLEEVFSRGSEEGTIIEMEIMLPNLTKINLKKLPNFVDICQGFKLKAEKLELLYKRMPEKFSNFESNADSWGNFCLKSVQCANVWSDDTECLDPLILYTHLI
ncbi:Leucine-rich repeat domain superfamily [Sesbania bispinosa]|nr:Leucine-rich repeat domain superfamily [Sesbania bispinosa]